jgi:hypothetical protein
MRVATMERVMTPSNSVLWARWLGWTLIFGLVVGACRLAYRWLAAGISPALSLVFLGLPLLMACLMGVGFPFWRWAAGPPVAVFLAGTPLLMLPYNVVAPLVPESLFEGMSYVKTITIAGFLLVFLMTITLVLSALAAAGGVWCGQRREDEAVLRGDERSNDGSRARHG